MADGTLYLLLFTLLAAIAIGVRMYMKQQPKPVDTGKVKSEAQAAVDLSFSAEEAAKQAAPGAPAPADPSAPGVPSAPSAPGAPAVPGAPAKTTGATEPPAKTTGGAASTPAAPSTPAGTATNIAATLAKDPQFYATIAANMVSDKILNKVFTKLANKMLERSASKMGSKALLKASLNSADNILEKLGTRMLTKATAKAATKAATSVGTGLAAKGATAAAAGPGAPIVAAAEFIFNATLGYMDSLNLGGFQDYTSGDDLMNQKKEMDKIFKEEVVKLGVEYPLLYGPLDRLGENGANAYTTALSTEITALMEAPNNEYIEGAMAKFRALPETRQGELALDSNAMTDFITSNIDMDKVIDKAVDTLCTKNNGKMVTLDGGRKQCGFADSKSCKNWPLTAQHPVYIEWNATTNQCEIKPSLMRVTCEKMGKGITYNETTGSCNLTEEYCLQKSGTKNCKIGKAQDIAESIFGRAFVRGILNVFDIENMYEPCPPGSINPTAWLAENISKNVDLGKASGAFNGFANMNLTCFSDKCQEPTEKGSGLGIGFCYAKCKDGFSSDGASQCIQNCPPGYDRTGGPMGFTCAKQCPDGFPKPTPGDVVSCAKPLPFDRAPVPAKLQCNPDEEVGSASAGLCYPKCKPGYTSDGITQCIQDCPPGYDRTGGPAGITCAKQCPAGTNKPTPGDVVSCTRPMQQGRDPVPTKPKCNADEDLVGLICYKKCRDGYSSPPGLPDWCYKNCDPGYNQTTVDFCAKDGCDANEERGTGLGVGFCYPKCRDGFGSNGVTLCLRGCDAGYTTYPLTCTRGSDSKGKGGCCARACAYGKCSDNGKCGNSCPAGYRNDPCTCFRDAHTYDRERYDRGAGRTFTKTYSRDRYKRDSASRMGCDDGRTQDTAGLCYKACPAGFRGVPGSVATCEHIPPPGFENGATAALYQRPVINSDKYSRGAGASRMKCDADRTQDTAGLCYKACPGGWHKTTVNFCEKDVPPGYTETAALLTRPITKSDTYLRKLEGPSLKMSLRKRKFPVPSTSENDVKNSSLGKRAMELGSAVKSGDPLAIASSAAIFSIASSPFTQAFGLAPLTDLIPSGNDLSNMANDAEW